MRGGARDGLMPDTPPCETLTATSSRPNSKALAVHVMLAHPRTVFHLRTCGLHRDAAALIGYDDVEVAAGTTIWRRRS
jgi:hypothetical protein